MTTLKQVRDTWHLLFDHEIPRLREGNEVQMLWSSGHYDGPSCGVCSYQSQLYWFDRISGGTHEVSYRGLRIRNYIYAMVEMTPAELELEKTINRLFREHVGDHCNYTYKVTEEDDDERDYTRVRGTNRVADTTAGYQTFCKLVLEEKYVRKFDRYYDKRVIAWWATD